MTYRLVEPFNQLTALMQAGLTHTEAKNSGGVCQVCAFYWVYHQLNGAPGRFGIDASAVEQKLEVLGNSKSYYGSNSDGGSWVAIMEKAMDTFGFVRATQQGPLRHTEASSALCSERSDAEFFLVLIGNRKSYNHYLGIQRSPSHSFGSDYDFKMFDPNKGTFTCNKKRHLAEWVAAIHSEYQPKLAQHDITTDWYVAGFNYRGRRHAPRRQSGMTY